MLILQKFESFVDWFVPATAARDPQLRSRIRMFLISHFFGPILGLPIPIFLLLYDPSPWPHVPILAAQIGAFWLFPIALKIFPRHYMTLALISVFNLSSAILWGSYNYGGASSPFLMWFLVMPLLAFFYMGSGTRIRIVIFAQITVGLAAFYAAFLMKNSFPVHIPVENMVEVGIVSAFCAATYVFLMAAYYSSVVDFTVGTAARNRPPSANHEDADGGERRRRARQRRQVRLPGQDEPRAAHAAQRRARLQRNPA